jgi:hypothetical protein
MDKAFLILFSVTMAIFVTIIAFFRPYDGKWHKCIIVVSILFIVFGSMLIFLDKS